MTRRMLVTGAHGLLGTEIVPMFRSGFEVVPVDLAHCDITVEADVARIFREARPDVVVHCAAYTAVDRAEAERELAFLVNGRGTRNVADACARAGSLLVTFGTDYVFDGSAVRPYVETDATRPISAYGESKLAGERACVESGAEFLSIRTQWLYGAGGRNFIFAILDRAMKGEPLRVVDDQAGCPTWARDLADAVRRLIDAEARGIVHFSNEGQTTWFEFARMIVAEALPGRPVEILPVRTESLALPAARPRFSPLDKACYTRLTGVAPRRWDEAAREFIARHIGDRP
jgi:dTDP-4-dehydrorhamnose reductase